MDEHKRKSVLAFMQLHKMKLGIEQEWANAVYDAVLNVPLVGDMLLHHEPKSAAKVMSTAVVSTAFQQWDEKRKAEA